jgi:hypothetical protein
VLDEYLNDNFLGRDEKYSQNSKRSINKYVINILEIQCYCWRNIVQMIILSQWNPHVLLMYAN